MQDFRKKLTRSVARIRKKEVKELAKLAGGELAGICLIFFDFKDIAVCIFPFQMSNIAWALFRRIAPIQSINLAECSLSNVY